MRVYSFLGGRPFQRGGSMAGCGGGAGFSSERLDPRMIPGCVLFCCTDTTTFPNAVVFPADPLADGNMEAAGVAAWGKWPAGATISKQGSAHSGTQCIRVLADAAGNPSIEQSVVAAGNTYRVHGWARSDGSGNAKPRAYLGGTARFTGTTSTDWQEFDFTNVATAGAKIEFMAVTVVAGQYCEFDDITVTCYNASQLTDLTGLGHHLVQVTAASQPLWVASGSGGVLRHDGAADFMRAAFALVQPEHVFLLVKGANNAANWYASDGANPATGALFHSSGATNLNVYAGSSLLGPAGLWGANWGIADTVFNGVNSAVGVNGGAPVTGNAGAAAMAGFCIGAQGDGAGMWSPVDIAAVIVYNRALSESERQRVVRWCNRLRARLAI